MRKGSKIAIRYRENKTAKYFLIAICQSR